VSASKNIKQAAERIEAAGAAEVDPLMGTVNVEQFGSESDCEAMAMATVVKLQSAGARFAEQTIVAKRNVGLLVWTAARLRVKAANDSGNAKVTMPKLEEATAGRLGKLLGLTDTPADGERSCEDRFGYKLQTLGACVDLARGLIGDFETVARADIAETGDTVTERNLRSAILARMNPDAMRNRAKGAETMQAARLAVAAGKAAGETVKVKTADGRSKSVKVDAVALTAVKNTVTASALSDAQIAALSDEAIDATIRALQLVKSARAAGTVKAPAIVKPEAKVKATK